MLLNDRITRWKDRKALRMIDGLGVCSYDDLTKERDGLAAWLAADQNISPGDRVAFMLPPGKNYVAMMLAIWKVAGIAVPLSPAYPVEELQYFLETVSPRLVVTNSEFSSKLNEAGRSLFIPVFDIQAVTHLGEATFHAPDSDDTALILFTSGTTSRPKGVMITHRNLTAQMDMLTQAWQWQSDDQILHVLPLHHVHGIVNAMLCALWAGAEICFMAKFDASSAWKAFISSQITVFMGVPTMYAKLLEAYECAPLHDQIRMSKAAKSLRLTVSGSAALPVALQERWKNISGRFLLERYGMTEIGMALGVPFEAGGCPGSVGVPFPSVEVKIVGETDNEGELWVKGPSVFAGYWDRPQETSEAFEGGWFKTGDMVAKDEMGYFRILGRKSTDILKSGGYKLSALEIEEAFREHPLVADCAVVGLVDETWGEVVGMAVVGKEGLKAADLGNWGRSRMAGYKVPRRILMVDELPRNAMGKVVKAKVKVLF